MPESQTAPSWAGARSDVPVHIAFRNEYSVGARFSLTFAAQWLAYAIPELWPKVGDGVNR